MGATANQDDWVVDTWLAFFENCGLPRTTRHGVRRSGLVLPIDRGVRIIPVTVAIADLTVWSMNAEFALALLRELPARVDRIALCLVK